MLLYDQLKAYKPYDEDEKASVEAFMRFIETFGDDIYTRDNIIGHVCGNAWVVNPDRTKSLLAHHNVYKGFHWMGGHADGMTDILEVAKKELREESGLKNFKLINDGNIFEVDTEYAVRQIKNGKAINAHLHFIVVYLFEASEDEEIFVNPQEHSDIKWFKNEDIVPITSEYMSNIYQRIVDKIQKLGV